jgi:hypothetical protein
MWWLTTADDNTPNVIARMQADVTASLMTRRNEHL